MIDEQPTDAATRPAASDAPDALAPLRAAVRDWLARLKVPGPYRYPVKPRRSILAKMAKVSHPVVSRLVGGDEITITAAQRIGAVVGIDVAVVCRPCSIQARSPG